MARKLNFKKPKQKPYRKGRKASVKHVNIKKTEFNYFESKIMSVLRKDREHIFASRELMRKSGLKEKESFYLALKSLEENGFVTVENHAVKLNTEQRQAECEIVSLSAGFGFARPVSGGEDIFIPGALLNGCLVGDKVMVTGIRKDDKGYSGRVSKVLEKGKSNITGTINETEDGIELIPDTSIRYRPYISPTHLNGAKNGDKVLVRLIQDYRGDWSYAQVIKVFGSGDSAKVCADAVIEKHGIPSVFPDEVLKEAEMIAAEKITDEEISKRLDLRNEAIFTIDGADAKDLDDAISCEKTENGFRLGVHIADVSHYVREGSLTDEEAFKRGTSVYFADRVIPMLPECISNGVCSLNAGTDKLTFSALVDLDENGKIIRYKFRKTIINSKVRGVYSEVNEIFNGTASDEIKEKYAPVMDGLNNARFLAAVLKKAAAARGTMDLDSGELKFVLDDEGKCIDVLPRESGEAEQMIEQLMITANIAAARFSRDNQIPFLYRIHEHPEPQRIRDLISLLTALNIPCKELNNETPSTKDFSAILDRVKGEPNEVLVSQRLLRTMEKAKYATEPLGHFGLALRDYSHFTSPIRRYPDTSIHRIMSALLSGTDSITMTKRYAAFADRSATSSSNNEVRAVNAERDAEDCYMAEYMKQHIGEKFTGIISGVTKNGVFVRLSNNVEGYVDCGLFTNNKFVYDGVITQKCVLTGRRLTIGMPLNIVVASAVVATGMVDFAPDEDNAK
ncbi:MAG: ribonuclease R [Clostridia bacterium]|nr:ribonuclease R [Clostridia bacterium]